MEYYNQHELAKELGISYQSVSAIIRKNGLSALKPYESIQRIPDKISKEAVLDFIEDKMTKPRGKGRKLSDGWIAFYNKHRGPKVELKPEPDPERDPVTKLTNRLKMRLWVKNAGILLEEFLDDVICRHADPTIETQNVSVKEMFNRYYTWKTGRIDRCLRKLLESITNYDDLKIISVVDLKSVVSEKFDYDYLSKLGLDPCIPSMCQGVSCIETGTCPTFMAGKCPFMKHISDKIYCDL